MFVRPRLRALAGLVLLAPLLATVVAVPSATADDGVIVIGNDAAPPTLDAVTPAASSLDVRDAQKTLRVSVHASDDLAGVEYVELSLRHPAGIATYWRVAALQPVNGAPGDPLDGVWATDIVVPRYAPDGDYRIGCAGRDKVKRMTYACTPDVTVQIVGGDVSPPQFGSIDLPVASLDVSQSAGAVPVDAVVTDDLAGVQYVRFSLRNVTANVSYDTIAATPTAGDNVWRGSVLIPRYAPPGTYRLSCTAQDFVGRSSSCSTSATVQITGGDAAPPVLGSLEVPTAPIDVTSSEGHVLTAAFAQDDLSGLDYVRFTLQNSAANVAYTGFGQLASGTSTAGRWSADITVPKYAPAGVYKLSCYGRDRVYRQSSDCGTPGEIVVVDHSVDLKTTLAASVETAAVGDTVSVTATVASGGAAAPTWPVLTVPVPAGAAFVDADPGCAYDADAVLVRCALSGADLEPGHQVIRNVSLKVLPTAGETIELSATASSDSVERTAGDNTGVLSIAVEEHEPAPEATSLSLEQTAGPGSVLPGDTVTYTLTAKAAATGGDAEGVVITDTLPAGLTFASAEGCTATGQVVTCEVGTVPAGTTATRTVRATVDAIPMLSDPNTAHQIIETKQETDMAVEPWATRSESVRCPDGFIATDGGIRIDAVEQGGRFADVQVLTSRATADGTGWEGTVRNDNGGRAHTKVTVACLRRTTVTQEHQHDLVTTVTAAADRVLPAGSTTVDLTCPAGYVGMTPSFALRTPAARVVSSAGTPTGWRFVVTSTADTTGDFSLGCLSQRTTESAGHTHYLGLETRDKTITVPGGQTVETDLTCADEAKGFVASIDPDAGLVSLGSDPRAKIRAYRFHNPGTAPLQARIGLRCVDIRTKVAPQQRTFRNVATVSTTSEDIDASDNATSSTVTAYGDGWALAPSGSASVAANGRAVSVPLRCASDCVVSARLSNGSGVLATGSAKVSAGDATSVTVRATRAGAKVLARHRTVRATLLVVTGDGARTTRTVTLRR